MVAAVAIDASVTAAWCFADEATAASDALRAGLIDQGAERRKRITPDRCAELLELLGELPIETDDGTQRIRGPVVRLARTHRLTVYDAIYLELAIRRELPLATRDKDLRKAALSAGVPLIAT
jgi:predicted nucleic acid-binding protein